MSHWPSNGGSRPQGHRRMKNKLRINISKYVIIVQKTKIEVCDKDLRGLHREFHQYTRLFDHPSPSPRRYSRTARAGRPPAAAVGKVIKLKTQASRSLWRNFEVNVP